MCLLICCLTIGSEAGADARRSAVTMVLRLQTRVWVCHPAGAGLAVSPDWSAKT